MSDDNIFPFPYARRKVSREEALREAAATKAADDADARLQRLRDTRRLVKDERRHIAENLGRLLSKLQIKPSDVLGRYLEKRKRYVCLVGERGNDRDTTYAAKGSAFAKIIETVAEIAEKRALSNKREIVYEALR